MTEQILLGFSAAVIMGLAYGAGACNVTCLPYLGPVFLGRPGGTRRSWQVIVPFSIGRLVGYSLLGAVAGGLGAVASEWFERGPAALILGSATVIVGLGVLWRSNAKGKCATSNGNKAPGQYKPRRQTMPLGLFGMGMGMALNPCAPLSTVLLAASTTASVWAGWIFGIGFGMGAVLLPALIFGLLVAYFGAQLRLRLIQWRRGLERASGMTLIVLGMVTAMGWVQP